MKVVDETEADLRALIERDFGPLAPEIAFRDSVRDWLHYQARSISRRPRKVTVSAEVQAHRANYPAIGTIEIALRNGGDVTPWLSDTVRRNAPNHKADMMFNDWQIIHFHLGQFFERRNKIKRSDNLLFAFIDPGKAVLLDVQPHGSWTMRNLLRILFRESPDDMARCEVKGLLGPSNHYTEEEILELRKVGINTMFEIDGRLFISPGFGLTSSRHATRLTRAADRLELSVAELRSAIENNTLPTDLLLQLSKNISQPVRLGAKLENGQITLYDKARSLNLMFIPIP